MISSAPNSGPSGVSVTVLVLSVLLAVASTAAIVLALRPAVPAQGEGNPAPGASGRAETLPTSQEPAVQKDTVTPGDGMTGQVYYPIPFATRPNLKLLSKKRQYEILKQDELGFTWAARVAIEDFDPAWIEKTKKDGGDVNFWIRAAFNSLDRTKLKQGLVFEEFTWEARGVAGARLPVAYEQTGTFTVRPNTEGEVVFPIPYAQPASVELTGNSYTIVSACRPTGFKWKNTCDKGEEWKASGNVTYKARGVRTVPK